jgi:heat shock protein HslJ
MLVTGSDAKGTFTPGSATVTLDLNGARSGGKGPCNAFGAKTSASTTGPIAIILGIRTEMACAEPELNTTEARYFAALGLVKTAAIASGRLSLTGGGDSLVFVRSTK